MRLSAARMLSRHWRSGELGILLGALVLAVALVVAMSGLMAQFERVLIGQSSQLLAADLVLQSRSPSVNQWRESAQEYQLQLAQTVSFPSMLFAENDAMQLVDIKAVSSGYPLRGELQWSEQAYGDIHTADTGPEPGKVWLESRLLALLGVSVGDKVSIGDASLQVAAVLRREPDQGGSVFSMGPRVLMHVDDLAATGVLQAGSRASYSTLFAGEAEAVARFKAYLQQHITASQRLLDSDSGPSAMARALSNARRYLLLAASLGVILAGFALVLAARRFALRHLNDVALLKSLGAQAGLIRRLYARLLLYLALIGIVLGSLLGGAVQWLMVWELLPDTPVQLSVSSFVLGAMTALVALACFAWPPLYRLGGANPLRVLRRDLPLQTVRESLDVSLGVAGLLALMWYYSGDVLMTLAVLAGVACIGVTTALLSALVLKLVRQLGMQAGSMWRLALSGLLRHRSSNALQVAVFALCFMLLFVLVLLRNSLLGDWRAQVPEGAPNHFLVNLRADEVPLVQKKLAALGLSAEAMYPMSRGRIVAVNGEALAAGDIISDDRRARQRESNLSASIELPPENTLLEGDWWPDTQFVNPVSLEQGYAQGLGLNVGDKVQYRVGAMTIDATVASIRQLRWESLRPNFFVLLPPEALEKLPASWMTSFYLPPQQKQQLNALVRAFPTVSIIEVDALIAQVQNLLAQVAAVIEVIVLMMLVAAALVMLAAVRASVDVRLQESALMRALGASRRLLLGGLAIEFAVLGAVAAVLALLGAECASWLLHGQLSLQYGLSIFWWVPGFVLVVAVVKLLGIFSCYRAVNVSPLVVLREV